MNTQIIPKSYDNRMASTASAVNLRTKNETEIMKPAFEQVYADEHKAMIGLAYLLVHSHSLAEEAVQDSFIKLLDRFDQVENPGGFLRKTTINKCHDLLRRKTKERNLIKKFFSKSEPSSTGVVTSELSDVLTNLDFDQREVVVLKYFLQHQNREIAQILNIPEGTVASRLHRGIKQLKGELA